MLGYFFFPWEILLPTGAGFAVLSECVCGLEREPCSCSGTLRLPAPLVPSLDAPSETFAFDWLNFHPSHPLNILLKLFNLLIKCLEQFNLLISFPPTPNCALKIKHICSFLIPNCIFMAFCVDKFCTQERFVYQFCSHIWQILTNRSSSFLSLLILAVACILQDSPGFYSTASYVKNKADRHSRLASGAISTICFGFKSWRN